MGISKKTSTKSVTKYPIIYSRHYDMKLYGIQKLHPFDTEKYSKVYRYLKKEFKLKKTNFYEPEKVSNKILLQVHTQGYLDSLYNPVNIARIAELTPLKNFPMSILEPKFLDPMKYATGGTLLGVDLALEHGWAINLSGGYHHAKSDSGGGFCYYADIPLAVLKLLENHPDFSILIIDLDAHQGNGVESILRDKPGVNIMDVYNKYVYPFDHDAKQYIDFDFPVSPGIRDEEYLKLLEENIPKIIKDIKPDFIIYNAGTDIYLEDALGQMSLTKTGIIKRDEIVFKHALKNKIPILMLLSGGYTKTSATIIKESIKNLIDKFELINIRGR